MVHSPKHGHYVAGSPAVQTSRGDRAVYWTDGEDSVASVHRPNRSAGRATPRDHDGSDIYVTSGAYRAPSEHSRGSLYSPSHYSYHSGAPTRHSRNCVSPSEVSTVKSVKSKTSRKGALVVETMSAPNPFCPNTRGMCCLMLLLNLGLILVTLGFVVVIQFFEPLFVWILGIIFLIFGFLTLIGSLIYCVSVCKDAKSPKDVNPEDLYWTRHWQKQIGSSEIHYKAEEKYPEDYYSDRYSVSKYSEREPHSDREPQSDQYSTSKYSTKDRKRPHDY